MRTYIRNSPEAAARIVALAMMADGHLSREELLVLDYLRAPEQLGLSEDRMDTVVNDFCQDLQSSMRLSWAEACHVDARTLAELMAEVDDAALRLRLLQICRSVVEADAHVSEGESAVLGAMVEHWGLHREMLPMANRELQQLPDRARRAG
jgi:uncharacterized tellurite resistance protein B-like protein